MNKIAYSQARRMDHFRRGYSTAVWNEAVTLIVPYS